MWVNVGGGTIEELDAIVDDFTYRLAAKPQGVLLRISIEISIEMVAVLVLFSIDLKKWPFQSNLQSNGRFPVLHQTCLSDLYRKRGTYYLLFLNLFSGLPRCE